MSACIGWGIFGFLIGGAAMFFLMVGIALASRPDETDDWFRPRAASNASPAPRQTSQTTTKGDISDENRQSPE